MCYRLHTRDLYNLIKQYHPDKFNLKKMCGPGINLALISISLFLRGKIVWTEPILFFTFILTVCWHMNDTTLMVEAIKEISLFPKGNFGPGWCGSVD